MTATAALGVVVLRASSVVELPFFCYEVEKQLHVEMKKSKRCILRGSAYLVKVNQLWSMGWYSDGDVPPSSCHDHCHGSCCTCLFVFPDAGD